MIPDAVVRLGVSLLGWIAGLFPPAPDSLEDTLSEGHGMWADLLTSFDGLGAWVDWAWVLTIVGLAVSIYLVMFVVKLLRAVASYLPFFGGAG